MAEVDLDQIQRDLYDALDDIWDSHIDANRSPSDKVLDGIGSVFGKSRNETRKLFDQRVADRNP